MLDGDYSGDAALIAFSGDCPPRDEPLLSLHGQRLRYHDPVNGDLVVRVGGVAANGAVRLAIARPDGGVLALDGKLDGDRFTGRVHGGTCDYAFDLRRDAPAEPPSGQPVPPLAPVAAEPLPAPRRPDVGTAALTDVLARLRRDAGEDAMATASPPTASPEPADPPRAAAPNAHPVMLAGLARPLPAPVPDPALGAAHALALARTAADGDSALRPLAVAMPALTARARGNDAVALYDIGYCYEHGLGVTSDAVRAYVAYIRAVVAPPPDGLDAQGEAALVRAARHGAEAVDGRLSPQDYAAALRELARGVPDGSTARNY
jgi:hypothetical protein